MWVCGGNGYGDLGDGTTTDRTKTVQLSGLCGVTPDTLSTISGIAQVTTPTSDISCSVYPNPGSGIFILKSATEILNIEVTNILGAPVLSQQINSESAIIDLNKESNGIYFVKIISEKAILSQKIIKE